MNLRICTRLSVAIVLGIARTLTSKAGSRHGPLQRHQPHHGQKARTRHSFLLADYYAHTS